VESFLDRIAHVWSPHAGQREFLLNTAKIKVLACGRRWGKTDACAVSIVAALHRDSPTRHVILAPTLDQARLLFDRFVEILLSVDSETPHTLRRSPYPRLTFGNHTVVARSGHLGRSLRGNEATHIVVDEAAFVPEELITEVAMPMLATTQGYLTLISTPRGMNHFWRFFQMGREASRRPARAAAATSNPPPPLVAHPQEGVSIWSRRAPSAESPHVPKSFLEVQKELISDRAFRVEYEAEFLEAAGAVFRTESIEACTVARLTAAPEPPFYIGVDWARYQDYTAVAVVSGSRQGATLVANDRFHGLSWTEQLARVRGTIERFPRSLVLCDQTGAGDPLLEMLRAGLSHAGVKGWTFTAASKAALIDGLAWMIERGTLAMEPHPELLRELQHFEASISPSGNQKLGAKQGFHDDLVVALALACRQLPREYGSGLRVGQSRQFSKRR
jgi:hypothetical protein